MSATYTTVQLDQWDWICFQRLGSEYVMGDLIAANSTMVNDIVDTIQFDPGMILNLPAPATPRPVVGAPPWRNVTQTS